MPLLCDAPDCYRDATWFVGLLVGDETGRGHPCCDRHVSQGARVTYAQHAREGRNAPLAILPIYAVGEDLDDLAPAPPPRRRRGP